MLDKEAQAACPDPIIRLPIDAVGRVLCDILGKQWFRLRVIC